MHGCDLPSTTEFDRYEKSVPVESLENFLKHGLASHHTSILLKQQMRLMIGTIFLE
ncbi:hypothetical protein Cflav_PD5734 [Pedosphaera parvula Ellin514]|uniref:Uncharacterized protein n=1 Tax=Pedosphaera parvula (strain Ellin514) TaxID=320771 RepID=B9XAR4_PEDPL|nr:hypothetical protein Cflav_PD5734 [Pedosphaera parvula Ellin514]